jgi:two-component system sensor histidine kinase AlgZ
MRTIINQNRDPLELPDLRNLGTILRILLAVNGMVFVAALAGDTQWRETSDAWVQMSAMVEPPLLVILRAVRAVAVAGARAVRSGRGVRATLSATVVLGFNIVLVATFETSRRRRCCDDCSSRCSSRRAAVLLRAAHQGVSHRRSRSAAALQVRIRPHFLFNSITACLLAYPQAAQAGRERASRTWRELFRVLMRDNRQPHPLL